MARRQSGSASSASQFAATLSVVEFGSFGSAWLAGGAGAQTRCSDNCRCLIGWDLGIGLTGLCFYSAQNQNYLEDMPPPPPTQKYSELDSHRYHLDSATPVGLCRLVANFYSRTPIPDFKRWHGRVGLWSWSRLASLAHEQPDAENRADGVHSILEMATRPSYSALICGLSVPGLQCPLRLSSVNRNTHNPFACFSRVSRVRILSCFVLPRGPGMSLQAGIDNTIRRPRWESWILPLSAARLDWETLRLDLFRAGSAAPGLGHIITA